MGNETTKDEWRDMVDSFIERSHDPGKSLKKKIDEELKVFFREKKGDKKWDQGKPMVGLMKRDFAEALLAVSEISKYGVQKYNQPGSWKLVENALDRYEDALGRHDLAMTYEDYDEESGYLHAMHRAWNALATLQIILSSGKPMKRSE